MKKISWKLSLAATLLGCGFILFAGGSADPLRGWKPLNAELEKALELQEGSETKAPDKSKSGESVSGIADVKVPGKEASAAEEVSAVPVTAASESPEGAVDPARPESLKPESSGKININTAGKSALMELPGIGEKKAQAILEYRDHHGTFKKDSDLLKVKGIGPKMLEKMKPYILL